jgi:hypothetical protein
MVCEIPRHPVPWLVLRCVTEDALMDFGAALVVRDTCSSRCFFMTSDTKTRADPLSLTGCWCSTMFCCCCPNNDTVSEIADLFTTQMLLAVHQVQSDCRRCCRCWSQDNLHDFTFLLSVFCSCLPDVVSACVSSVLSTGTWWSTNRSFDEVEQGVREEEEGEVRNFLFACMHVLTMCSIRRSVCVSECLMRDLSLSLSPHSLSHTVTRQSPRDRRQIDQQRKWERRGRQSHNNALRLMR